MRLPHEQLQSVNRIVVCTLDSLYSAVGIHELVKAFQGRVVCIVSSDRYKGPYGSFWRQFVLNWRRSGFSFVHYLSCHFVYFYTFLLLTDTLNVVFRRSKKVYSVRQLCKTFNIPRIHTAHPNSKAVVEQIRDFQPDLIITAYFDRIIRQELINMPTFGVINVHTSLLPDFKGPFPSLWPIIKKSFKIGVSVHYINSERLDEGPIILQRACPWIVGESVLGTDCRLFRAGIELLGEAILQIENGTARSLTPENKGRSQYFSFPTRADLKELKRHHIPLVTLRDFVRQFW